MNKQEIINSVIGILITASIFYGLYVFAAGPFARWNEAKMQQEKNERIAKELRYSNAKSLSLNDIVKLSEVCTKSGLIPNKRYNKDKIVDVFCSQPRTPTTTGDGITNAAGMAVGAYVGGKVLNAMFK